MLSASELACTYTTLILHDEDIPITAAKIATLLKAANAPVEPYWLGLFAKLAKKKNIQDLILNSGAGGAVAAPAPGVGDATTPTTAAAAPPPEDKKKEEPKEESDDDCLIFDLFN